VTKKARGDIPHPVIPRHASAEGPLADARGDKKGVARGDMKRVRADKIKWMGLTKWAQAEGVMATSNRLSLTKPS